MELVPDASGRFVEARISPMDIDRVQVTSLLKCGSRYLKTLIW